MNNSTDSSKYVDINDLIVQYAKNFPFPKEVKKEIDLDHISYEDIEDSDLIIDQQTIEYTPKKLMDNETRTHIVIAGKRKPKSSVVFSCVFKNQTSAEQQNTLQTSRETRSTTTISMSKSILKEGSFNLQLQAPNSAMQANAGFKKSVTIDKKREYSLEEVLNWTANSNVVVGPGKQVKAELIVNEDEVNFDFKIKTTLSGVLKIYLKNKKTGWRLEYPIEVNDLTSIFTAKDGFVKNPDNTVSFICYGTCYSRYGMSQKLNLIESTIDNNSVSDED